MKEELFEELTKIIETLKDQVKFIHLFSKDEGQKTLAKLLQSAHIAMLLLGANEIKDVCHPKNKAIQDGFMGEKTGSLVKIRPCGEEYKNKTYLGFYIGDVALGSSITTENDKIQLNFSGHNPAIFVPELKKIIYGCESWWGTIEDEKELSDITDNDIQNVWYVKLLKAMTNGKNDTTGA